MLSLLLKKCVIGVFGLQRIENFVKLVIRWVGLDMLRIAYQNEGILNYKDYNESGEAFLINTILPIALKNGVPVIFDVGANVGQISELLSKQFPKAQIHSFEPNPHAYEILATKFSERNVKCINIGLGSESKLVNLYTYSSDQTSGHATMHKGMFDMYRNYGVQQAENLVQIEVNVKSLDNYCTVESINLIDFLKLDVEGNELDVLNGASSMLANNNIRFIQFEFNDCNVFSRTFLRDFYLLLSDFSFFRLDSYRLVPMEIYCPRYEIFQFQNILAVNRSWLNRNSTELNRYVEN